MITLIKEVCKAQGLNDSQANIIVCQAAHESNYFSSNVFKNSNNLFGIRSHSRPIEKLNILYNGYTSYKSPKDSVNDLIDLIRRRNIIKALISIPVYAQELKRVRYYEAEYSEYVNGMQRAYKKLFTDATKI